MNSHTGAKRRLSRSGFSGDADCVGRQHTNVHFLGVRNISARSPT